MTYTPKRAETFNPDWKWYFVLCFRDTANSFESVRKNHYNQRKWKIIYTFFSFRAYTSQWHTPLSEPKLSIRIENGTLFSAFETLQTHWNQSAKIIGRIAMCYWTCPGIQGLSRIGPGRQVLIAKTCFDLLIFNQTVEQHASLCSNETYDWKSCVLLANRWKVLTAKPRFQFSSPQIMPSFFCWQ